MVVGCNKRADGIELPTPTPVEFGQIEGPVKVVNTKTGSTDLKTSIYVDGTTTLELKKPEGSKVSLIELSQEEAISAMIAFVKFESKGISYRVLPEEHINVTLNDGSPVSLTVDVTGIRDLGYGDFLYPIALDVSGETIYHYIHVVKEPEFTPITDQMQKPFPPSTFGGPVPNEPIKMVAYVETNDWDIRNMANFVLSDSKQPVFDMVVLFAANMNWNAVENKRYIHFNKELKPIIDNPEIYIRPLQDRGIKVIVDILPNHQGVGYANFQSYEEAVEFAKEAKKWTELTGIDGWDIDEEYADYWNLPQYSKNNESWLWFAKAMKEVMPDKLLTLYDYNHEYSGTWADADNKYPKDYIDYSWSDYGMRQTSYAGIPNERYGSQSIQAGYGNLWYNGARNIAIDNLKGGFGLLMVFNIKGEDIISGSSAEGLSGATEIYYGQKTIFEGKYYVGPKGR